MNTIDRDRLQKVILKGICDTYPPVPDEEHSTEGTMDTGWIKERCITIMELSDDEINIFMLNKGYCAKIDASGDIAWKMYYRIEQQPIE